jgi:dienelactone hydrolase
MIDEWHKLADQQGFILLAPDSLVSRSWQGPFDGPGFLQKVVDEVCHAYPVDKSRIYLFGHSGGGHFALMIGLMESEYFAAVAVHAGAIPTAAESFVNVATRKIPFAIWAGDRDRLVPSTEVKRTAELLERNGFPVRLSVLPRHDHDYSAVSTKVNAEAWAFLSAHSLEKPPRYVDYGDRDEPPAKGAP